MSCVSSKSSDKKSKKGKSPLKKKQTKETANADAKQESEKVYTEGESSNSVADEDVDEPVIPQSDDKSNGEENESSNCNSSVSAKEQTEINGTQFEDETKSMESSTAESKAEVMEEHTDDLVNNKSDGNQDFDKEEKVLESFENEPTDKKNDELETDQKNDNISNQPEESVISEKVEFTVQDADNYSDFVVIETPGETNDEPSESENIQNAESENVVKTMEPFSEFVDVHAVNQAIKASNDSHESDMDVNSELLLQYLNKHHKKHLKMTIRKAGWSVTDDVRKILWQKLCQHLYKADTDDVLHEYVDTLFSDSSDGAMRYPSFVDVHHMPHYSLNKEGLKAIQQILCVLEITNPDIVYSPMLHPIMCLLLHYTDITQCYNCIYALLRNPAFISQTKLCYEASKLVIRDLTKRHAKSGYIFLVRNCTSVDAVFDSWVWWLFKDLPFHYLVRVFDCYLLEGVKVLYRVAMSILIHFAKSHGKKSSIPKTDHSGNSAIISALRQFCQEMPVSIEKLLKTGFSIRGLKRKDIQKLQVKHEMYIKSQRHLGQNGDSTNQMPMSRSFSGPIVLQNTSSDTLTQDMLLAVWTWLPTRYAVCQPELLYTSEEHGTSLVTLYQRVENHQPTIIVIKTTTDEIFGAFCSTYWKERRCQSSNHLSYFGTGETFIFTLWPEKKKYQWVGLSGEDIPNTANMFQAGDRSILTIGGGHGEAIYLDENLIHCRTEKCDTFNNEPLSQNEDFMCKVVEVYGFSD